MPLKIHVLNLGVVGHVDASFLVDKYSPGKPVDVPMFSYLIEGGEKRILVDTGFSHPDIMKRVGMRGEQKPEQDIVRLLKAKFRLSPDDVDILTHTHLHIDHAGRDDAFPNSRIIIQRRELMFSVSGMMGNQYPPEYIICLIKAYNQGKVHLIDGDLEIIPGVRFILAPGHTWGSQNIDVETAKGKATICGDIIYDIEKQWEKIPEGCPQWVECWPTGNYWNSMEARKWVYKICTEAKFILPIHDASVLRRYGEVIPP